VAEVGGEFKINFNIMMTIFRTRSQLFFGCFFSLLFLVSHSIPFDLQTTFNLFPPVKFGFSEDTISTFDDMVSSPQTLNAPNQTLAKDYLQSYMDFQHEFLSLKGKQDFATPPVPETESQHYSGKGWNFVPQPTVNRLKLFAYLTSTSYCMQWNLVPAFKCGYPRCSNPGLTLSSLFTVNSTVSPTIPTYYLFQDILSNTKIIKYFYSKDTSALGFVAVNPVLDFYPSAFSTDLKKAIVVSFRGSLVPKNFLHDLMVAQTDYVFSGSPSHFNAKVHVGFWKSWKSVEEEVLQSIREAIRSLNSGDSTWPGLPTNYHLVITGHSLG
jgi:hypothetical protein